MDYFIFYQLYSSIVVLFGINSVSDEFSKFYLYNGGAIGSDKKREAILLGKMNLALRRKQDPKMAFFTLGLWLIS